MILTILDPIEKYVSDMEELLEVKFTRDDLPNILEGEFQPSHIVMFIDTYYPRGIMRGPYD